MAGEEDDHGASRPKKALPEPIRPLEGPGWATALHRPRPAQVGASDFDRVDALVWRELLGQQRPLGTGPFRGEKPEDWPEDFAGLEYLHRGLLRLLVKGGRTYEAARAIRADLQEGRLVAVLVGNLEKIPVPSASWTGPYSKERWWQGSMTLRIPGRRIRTRGDIYLATAPEVAKAEVSADEWRIGSESAASWARTAPAQGEARRRLAAVGETDPPKERISFVLTVMARECGRELAAETIDRSMRRKPKTSRTPGR